jgi:oligoribonuclease
MTASANNLIWIDMEMSGLDPEKERIIEIATIVTDSQLNIIAEGPVYAIHQAAQWFRLSKTRERKHGH